MMNSMIFRKRRYIILILVIISGFCFTTHPVKAQVSKGTLDIKEAIGIVSSALGVKIIVDSDIQGQIELDLENSSPRQIKEGLEKSLNEAGFLWIAKGGIVRITKSGRIPRRSPTQEKPPLSYYMDVISKNNLFLPLGSGGEEAKIEFVLMGMFGIGQNRRAIIEDVINNRSYYVSRGESVGGFSVIDITEDQVVLAQGTNRINLRFQK